MANLAYWNALNSRAKDLFNIPHFNYLKGDSPIDCTYTLSSVIALCSAKIHESHFGSWANLNHERIKHVGAFYEFKGPVWIVAGTAFPEGVKTLGIMGCAFIGGAAIGLITYALQISTRSKPQRNGEPLPSPLPAALGIIAGIGSGVMASKLLGKVIPTTRGVFFYNFPSFVK